MLRVAPAAAGSLIDNDGARPFLMNGHEPAGWLHVDAELVDTEDALRGWLEHALTFARTLSPK